MWATLFGTWLRYAIVTATTFIAANPNFVQWLGPDVVALLQRESTVTYIVAGIINGLTVLWGTRNKIFDQLDTLKARVRNRTTTIAEIKAEVKEEASKPKLLGGLIAVPSKEQRAEAFHTEPPVERVMSN